MLSSATDLCYRCHCGRNLSVKGAKGGNSGRKRQGVEAVFPSHSQGIICTTQATGQQALGLDATASVCTVGSSQEPGCAEPARQSDHNRNVSTHLRGKADQKVAITFLFFQMWSPWEE